MPTFSFIICCTIIQVQGDINLTDRSQTTTNMDSFNAISSTLTNQSSAPESPLGHGIPYFYFARPPRGLRLLWFLESTTDAAPSFEDVSSLSATSGKSHISWCYGLDTHKEVLSSNKIPCSICRVTECYRPGQMHVAR